tara:strand:+ start:12062 stop:13084 length:1023 start_codon:yes stop_codon:yes gene_type:complete
MAILEGTSFFQESLSNLTSSGSNAGTNAPPAEPLRYPIDMIAETTDYFKLDILEYPRNGGGTAGFSALQEGDKLSTIRSSEVTDVAAKARAKQTIILPIPQSVKDTNGAGWREDQLNDVNALLAQGGINLMESSAFGLNTIANAFANPSKAGNQVKSQFSDLANSGRAQGLVDLIKARAAASTANLVGGNVSANGLLSRATGQIVNQNTEVLFNSVKLRGFDFGWDLTPRSQTEGIMCGKIIKMLKKSLSPKFDRANPTGFLNAPDIFRITYMKGSGEHPFLNKFKALALKNMSMNYTGSNTYATYSDGTPIHMQLQLTFMELNPIYSEDYAGTTNGVGF